MVRRLFGWVRCLRGVHERSERQVHKKGPHFTSRCRYCGRRMWRRGKRDWLVGRPPATE